LYNQRIGGLEHTVFILNLFFVASVCFLRRMQYTTGGPDQFAVTPQALSAITQILKTGPNPYPMQPQPPAQQLPPSDFAYGLPISAQTPEQQNDNHNKAIHYTWYLQKLYGVDPIEYDGPPTCFSRDRQIVCKKMFNMTSDTAVKYTGHILNALGAAGIALTIAFEVMWMFNGKGENERDFTWLMHDRNSAANWWVPFPGLFGFACFAAAHVLYMIGGAYIPSVFLLVCDAAGLGGGFVIELSSSSATNRMIGLAMTFGACTFLSMIQFIILACRDPMYTIPPPRAVQMPLQVAPQDISSVPRVAGVPIYAGGAGTELAQAAGYSPQQMQFPNFSAQRARTGGKGKVKGKGGKG